MTPIGPTGAVISGVALDPVARTLYGSDPLTTGNLHQLNLTTGAASPVGALGVGSIGDLAWDATTSTLYGLTPTSLYVIDTVTGAATLVGGTTGLRDSIAVHPVTGTMYATTTFPNALYTLNKATGASTAGPAMPLGAASLGYSTAESSFFGTGVALMKIDVSTGLATPVDGLGFQITHVAWDPGSHTLYGIDGYSPRLFSIDASTGKSTFLTPINTTILRTFTVDRETHTLWGTDLNNHLVTIDPATGAVADIGATAIFPSALAYHPGLHKLLVVDLAGSDRLFSLNAATGASTLIGPIGFTDLTSLTYDPTTGRLLGYDAATDQLLDIDPATGAGTATARGKGAISSLVVQD
jgi:sugar lactone lactonase YvrE